MLPNKTLLPLFKKTCMYSYSSRNKSRNISLTTHIPILFKPELILSQKYYFTIINYKKISV